MAFIPLLLSIVLVVGLYASLVKLAARFYRRSALSWKAAFGFGALMAPLAILVALLNRTLPAAVTLSAGLVSAVAVGAWFLASRVKTTLGQPVGYKAAAALSAIALGMAFVFSIVLATVLPAIVPR